MSTPRIAALLTRRPRFGREGVKIAAGLLLITAILFGQDVVGAATASTRLAPSLRDAAGPSNVIAVLNFVPERFHNERLARYGVFAGRDGAVGRIRLRMVSPENLRRLANLAWVARLEPMPTPPGLRPTPARPTAPAAGG